MDESTLGGFVNGDGNSELEYVETDPSGRYGRFKEVLGKGAMKTVYKAFDEVLAMEVAWNQVKINDVFRSPEEVQRLHSEVHFLKKLKHESILKFYTSWIDVHRRTFNFITEMFTSGTLREYRQKYQRVDIQAVKRWASQILLGLVYLHSQEPSVIHRDLKCDNIFVNGHLGQVKIGDFGLASVLRGSQAHSVIGTPEFMAPEMYDENYNELVDIYSFGMCVLEMLTSEYPYGECSNPAQIYKKVTLGKLPEAFYRIEDVKAQHFVGKCLETVSKRLPAKDLLLDPFLSSDESNSLPMHMLKVKIPLRRPTPNGILTGQKKKTNMTITGTMDPEDDAIFLKVQISGKDGHTRNIYFPFDIFNDTATEVAVEMVKELEIIDWEPLEIAKMIEEQICVLVPNWKEIVSISSHQFHQQQHSFSYISDYEDEDDHDNSQIPHPFYRSSSYSSSQASLPALLPSYNSLFLSGHDENSDHIGLQPEDLDYDEDASSSGSFNYSTIDYNSCNEDEDDSTAKGAEPNSITRNPKCTRFCPSSIMNMDRKQGQSLRSCDSLNQRKKMNRIRSLVDVRSQLLHRSLLEEVSKRRLFKTIGSIENIGFHDPN